MTLAKARLEISQDYGELRANNARLLQLVLYRMPRAALDFTAWFLMKNY